MSGLQTKGYMCCPTCGPDLIGVARRSPVLNKVVYMGHTQYLPIDHPMRKDPRYYLDPWHGSDDVRPIPVPKTKGYWNDRWEQVSDPNDPLQYFRCGIVHESIFGELEYWEELKINHLLDPMHMEGNIVRSLMRHMFGMAAGQWRAACMEQGVHPDLWSYTNDAGRHVQGPDAPWILSAQDRKEFRARIAGMKFPTNYGANLHGAFADKDETKWPSFLKTHDYHRLIQHIIPIAIIGLGSEELRDAVWSLGKLMRWICAKEIPIDDIANMEVFSVEVVCELERALPPSFFDGQIHLLVHLVREVSIAGPVHCRWMYWVERYMGYLKSLVRTRARVEGSIAERYLAAESMFYCSSILGTVDPDCPRGFLEEVDMVDDDRLTGAKGERILSTLEVKQVNTFMLSNSDVTEDWRANYEEERRMSRRPTKFPAFIDYMRKKLEEWDDLMGRGEEMSHFPKVNDDLRTLVHGPLFTVSTRTAMWSKGRHFRIARLDDKKRVTFDCGVMATYTQDSRSSRHDTNMVRSNVTHYGKVEEILTVTYDSYTKFDEVLFKCKWFKVNLEGNNATLVDDPCGFPRLKTTPTSVYREDWSSSEPFAFPHHLEQCFYVPYPIPPGPEDWSIVVPYTPRSRCVVQERSNVIVGQEVDQEDDTS